MQNQVVPLFVHFVCALVGFLDVPDNSGIFLLLVACNSDENGSSGDSATDHIRSAESRGVDIDWFIADSVLYEILVGAPVLRMFRW